jgi:ubiquinone/menaquinone biosynthesis C-methylase UbiE
MHFATLLLISAGARKALRITVAFVLATYLVRQFRKPSRWVGRPFLWLMNQRHSPLTDWGLEHVSIASNFSILDVGCGGGRTIHKLAALASAGKIYGVDYAKGSIAATRAYNADLIQSGRVAVVQGSVSALPFPDNSFDLVTAVETQYFWPDLLNDMKELRRVLKPGAALVIIAEAYKTGGASAQNAILKFLGNGCLSVAEHRQLFADAGYSDIQVSEDRKRRWISVTGRKP